MLNLDANFQEEIKKSKVLVIIPNQQKLNKILEKLITTNEIEPSTKLGYDNAWNLINSYNKRPVRLNQGKQRHLRYKKDLMKIERLANKFIKVCLKEL